MVEKTMEEECKMARKNRAKAKLKGGAIPMLLKPKGGPTKKYRYWRGGVELD